MPHARTAHSGEIEALREGGRVRESYRFGLPIFFGVLSALGGCKVGPDFTRPQVTIPEGWGAKNDPRVATQAAVDLQWWRSFNDAALDRLVDLAYRQNLPLQVAGLKIAEARAQLGIATGMQFPQQQELFANASAVGLSQHDPNIINFDRHYFTYAVGFDAAWELDFWGKYGRGVEAAAAGLLASVADYYSGLVSLTAEVARTYATIRTYEVLIDLARENARIQEDGLHIAESRFRNGATSELDVTQATTQLEGTRATIPQLQIKLQQARNALCTLLGQPPGTVEALLTGPKEIPKGPARVGVSIPAEMLRRRPDIRSAELTAAAQCALIGVAKAELYPSFSLFGTIGFRTSSGTIGPPSSYSFGNSLFYLAGPRVSWPFFNYGRLENGVRVQDARFQQLITSYRNTVLSAAQEVEDAMAGFLNAQEATTYEQNSVRAAQRSVEISVSAYREGAVDFQRVLDAQRSLLQVQNDLAQTRSTVATSLIALYKALGGGWETRQGQPFISEPTQREMKQRTNWGDMLSQPRSQEVQKSSVTGSP
jgi:NodT family efflux transporter outer membrane factor (OMF) lipoprotein